MPSFTLQAKTLAGVTVYETVNAPTESAARRAVREKGLFPIKVRKPPIWHSDPAKIHVKAKDVAHLFEQLELQLSAGVMPEQAIAALKEEFPAAKMRAVLREVHADLSSSTGNLHQSFARFPRTFPPDVLAIIETGQSAGSAELAKRFAELRERIEFSSGVRRTFVDASAYPAFVTLFAGLLITFMMGSVFPKMVELLYSLGAKLPPLTLFVISVSNFFRHYMWGIIGTIVAVPVLLMFLRRSVPPFALLTDVLMTKIPLISAVQRSLTTALVAKTYRSLYMANKPATESLEMCSRIVSNRAVAAHLLTVRDGVLAGKPLFTAFRRCGYFPVMACLTMEVGENGGKLDEALNRIATYYEKDARRNIEIALGVLKPTLILGIVGFAGVVILSFFIPMISIVQNLK